MLLKLITLAGYNRQCSLSIRRSFSHWLSSPMSCSAGWLAGSGYSGYDTAYEKAISDESLTSHVLTEHRWLLTRDRYLVQRKILRDRHTLIASDHLQEQLRQLQSELQIELNLGDRTASRCAACNNILIVISHEKATSTVPAYVASLHPRFVQCQNCGRVYWPGTHWTHMLPRTCKN